MANEFNKQNLFSGTRKLSTEEETLAQLFPGASASARRRSRSAAPCGCRWPRPAHVASARDGGRPLGWRGAGARHSAARRGNGTRGWGAREVGEERDGASGAQASHRSGQLQPRNVLETAAVWPVPGGDGVNGRSTSTAAGRGAAPDRRPPPPAPAARPLLLQGGVFRRRWRRVYCTGHVL
ncbi:translation initiation factor IF-2-like [Tympanuchus pallidicinctus]|uniref:translation initiation factor IF-2-like n=1 Tax=Tympanuchus pallidicinctus TaxID=109042 RepID=UPI002287638A|nr:translation initiation factor IF-2-like [Tympanuchus pallidicinctus]